MKTKTRFRLHLAPCRNGMGVRTSSHILTGDEVLAVRGPILRADEIRDRPRVLQLGPDRYVDPSGSLASHVNHSCEPNCGLVERDGLLTLVALHRIQPGHEITFDHSTSMVDGEWSFGCRCGAAKCRGHIGSFATLPRAVQKRYVTRGIVPYRTKRRRDDRVAVALEAC